MASIRSSDRRAMPRPFLKPVSNCSVSLMMLSSNERRRPEERRQSQMLGESTARIRAGDAVVCLIEVYLIATAVSICASSPSVPLTPTAATTSASCSTGSTGFGNAFGITDGTNGTAPDSTNSLSAGRRNAA